MTDRRSIDQMLADAQARIDRLDVRAAFEAQRSGACLIDTRSPDMQERDGHIPGALELPLNVLEWRVDPDSPHRAESAPDLDDTVVVICAHGFSSSLAVLRLQELGFTNVADVVGGFDAWQQQGQPVVD